MQTRLAAALLLLPLLVLSPAAKPARAGQTTAPEAAPATADADKLAANLGKAALAGRRDIIEKYAAPALLTLEKGLASAKHKDEVYFALYLCYAVTNQVEKAFDSIAHAHQLAPTNVAYTSSYALSVKMSGRNREARDIYQKLSDENGHPLGMQVMLAGLDMTLQEYTPAVVIFEKLTASLSAYSALDQSMLLMQLGDCYLYQGKYREAVDTLRAAMKIKPTVVGNSRFGEALLKQGDPKGSLPVFDAALAENPDDDRALYYKGIALEKLGRPAEAPPLFRRALAQEKKDNTANGDEGEQVYLLGLVEQKLGDTAAAQASFARARRLGFTYEAPYKK